MNLPNNDTTKLDINQRYQYVIKQAVANAEIWLLTDEHGCVMLNSEEEDCVPIWPSKQDAQAWATAEWAQCKPKAITLKQWRQRWTPGLEEDELAIVVFPLQDETGLVVYPEEFDQALQQQIKKRQTG